MKPRRTYSTEDKATALLLLDLNRGNVKRAAQVAGIPRKTLAQWKDGKGVSAEVVSLHYARGSDLADRFEHFIHLMLDSISPQKIAEMTGLEAVKASAILVDKMQLLRGQPTQLVTCRHCARHVA
jgi:hypothetical protein